MSEYIEIIDTASQTSAIRHYPVRAHHGQEKPMSS